MTNRIIYTLLALLLSISTYAQSISDTKFNHIGLEDGLSQSTVLAIAQDGSKSLWFSTLDGVNRYDGYDFTIYRNNPADTTTIASEISRTLYVDEMGRVWIGTRGGLSLYNRERDDFSNYYYEKDGKRCEVLEICAISNERLLVGTSGGTLIFDIETGRFVETGFNEQLRRLIPNVLYRHGRTIYIGTTDGLYSLSIESRAVSRVDIGEERVDVQTLLFQGTNSLWIGSEGQGLFLYDTTTHECRNFRNTPDDPHSLISDYLRALAFDDRGRLWVGTINGLSIYDEVSEEFSSFVNNPTDPTSISQNSIRSILRDHQGGMWLGTYFGGINYCHHLKQHFSNLRHTPYHNSLSDNVVSCIVEDGKHNLWIGTNDGGLNYYDVEKRWFTHYPFARGATGGVASNNIKCVMAAAEDCVYVGTHAGGLSILNPMSGRTEHFTTSNSEIISNNVYSIIPDMGDKLWVGTLGGLMRFDPVTRRFEMVEQTADGSELALTQIFTLFRDSYGRLWVGSESGVRRFLEDGNGALREDPTWSVTQMAATQFTNCIYESRTGRIFIGTRAGIFSIDEGRNEMEHYSTENYLPSNVVYGVLEDIFGRIWISSNGGLSSFNIDNHSIKTYTAMDGVQSNQFNTYAYCRTKRGEMYFGGVNGITYFTAEEVKDNPYAPEAEISELYLNSERVMAGDATHILSRDISETDSIVLQPDQNSISLRLSVSNYVAGKQNTFAYKLEGFDEEWIETTNERVISYKRLPVGSYTLRVNVANNDYVWSSVTKSLRIEVCAYWYELWWVRLIMLALIIFVLYYIFTLYRARGEIKHQLEITELEQARQSEINNMKTEFYINMSHELRTPLTLILSPVQELLAKVSDRWVSEQLTYINKNANRLLYLVNQLMDYRRAELGIFKLKVRQGNLHENILNHFFFFDKVASQREIDYNFYSDLQDESILFDHKYIDLIINNLLSNAFKFTEAGDRIYIRLSRSAEDVVIEVCDTGVGIAKSKQEKIFERFAQATDNKLGTGIGLSLVKKLVELHHGSLTLKSDEGEGCAFSISIPQSRETYAPEEIDNIEESEGIITDGDRYTTNPREMYLLDMEDETTVESGGESKRGVILIVDDNEDVRNFISSGLSEFYTTLVARNGEEALSILRDNSVDLVLTDSMMPVMDGLELCRRIKQNAKSYHIPVYIISAKGETEDHLSGMKAGADDYISKPFSMARLTSKIQNTLRTRHRAFEHYSKSIDIQPEKISTNAQEEELLNRAIEVVQANMDNVDFSTEQFASQMNMSRSGLHLKLKAITGQSAIDFIHKIRFARACELLREGRYSVSEISYMVGYNTPSYFALRFKKYMNCIPSEYVKNLTKQ